MRRQPVPPRNLSSAGYDPSTEILEIEFNGGGIYQYFAVPASVYESLIKASSSGKYFHSNVKEVYKYQRVS